MKGQYLAVETVFTIGMGLTLAIGTISVFGSYQDRISDSTQQKEIEMIHYRLKSAAYELKDADSGRLNVELPEEVGGVDYSVAINDDVRVATTEGDYTSNLNNFQEYDMQGSVSGGEVTLYKDNNQFILRSN